MNCADVFELYGVKPSDEQTEITFSTYGNDYDWNRFEIRDRFGNRWVNVYAKDILSEDELETMKSVVSDFYNENLHSEKRSGIEEFIDVSDNAYEDSQKTGNNLYVYDAEPKMQQMSLFGDDTADLTSENERKEEIISSICSDKSFIFSSRFSILCVIIPRRAIKSWWSVSVPLYCEHCSFQAYLSSVKRSSYFECLPNAERDIDNIISYDSKIDC